MISALILGRKGSQGFPGKNRLKVLGHPLAYYPMRAAVKTPEIDNVYLSTDDPELKSLAKENGVNIIDRPDYLATSQASGEDTFVDGWKEIEKCHPGKTIELLVLLMCNAPRIESSVLREGIQVLREHPEVDSAVTVSKYNMWSPLRARKINEEGLLEPFIPFRYFENQGELNCHRDSQGDAWFADMCTSIVRPRCLENIESGLLPQKWMGQKIYPLKHEAGLDVDYEWQIPQVEWWIKKHL